LRCCSVDKAICWYGIDNMFYQFEMMFRAQIGSREEIKDYKNRFQIPTFWSPKTTVAVITKL